MRHHLALLSMVVSSLAGAQQSGVVPRTAGTSGDTIIVSLRALVLTALRQSLDVRAAALLPQFAGADLLAARGGFDASLELATENIGASSDVVRTSPRTTESALANRATLGSVLPFGSQLALSATSSRSRLDPFAASASQPFATSRTSGLGFTLTQPLLRNFGRVGSYGAVDAAVASLDASRGRRDRGADVAVALVERAYWTLREAESNELVAQQSADAARAIFDRNVALQLRDVATALDVLTSERGLATRETQEMEATRQRLDAADRLLYLVYGEEARGRTMLDAARVRTAPDSLEVPSVPALDAAEAAALAQRGDVRAAVLEEEAGRRRARQARNQRLPRLDLTASYGTGGTAARSSFLDYGETGDRRSSSWSWGFSTSLFQRNDAARAADQRAATSLALAELSRMAAENAARADVRSALRALTAGRDRYLRARDVRRLAEREYALALDGSRLGLVTTFQLLQYEDALAQARTLVSQARFALEDAGSVYRLATGAGRAAYVQPGGANER